MRETLPALALCALTWLLVAAGCSSAPPSFTDAGDTPASDAAPDGSFDSAPPDADSAIPDTEETASPSDGNQADGDGGGADGEPTGDATPDGADPDATDTSAPVCGPGECGNGAFEPGESCDPGHPPGVGACLPTCFDGLACTRDVRIGASALCTSYCTFEPVTTCTDLDGCCAPGCTPTTDSDCTSTCGNGALNPGELCDGDCPSAGDCDDGDPCTDDVYSGSPAGCSAGCTHYPRVGCWNPDTQCCGGICKPGTEPTCPKSTCGNGILEPGEICDGDCPTSCSPAPGCAAETLVGSSERCTAQCVPATPCQNGDGCCPESCSINDDDDCTTLQCLCITCSPPASVCSWDGVERTAHEGLVCATAGGSPKCTSKSYVELCPYACVAGECLEPPCVTSTGAPRLDFCGDAVDDDCDGSPRACVPLPTDSTPVHPTITIGPGCTATPDEVDLWTLAAAFPGQPLSPDVELVNATSGNASWTNGVEGGTLAPEATVIAPTGAEWGVTGGVTVTPPGCAPLTIPVAYTSAPESPFVAVGVIKLAGAPPKPDGTPATTPARIEVQALPLPLGGNEPQGKNPPATLRECVGYPTCTTRALVRVVVTGSPGVDQTVSPSTPSTAYVSWNIVGPILHVLITGPDGALVGSLKGPPNHLTGTLQGLPSAYAEGEWALHAE